jgi:hypothetical protein
MITTDDIRLGLREVEEDREARAALPALYERAADLTARLSHPYECEETGEELEDADAYFSHELEKVHATIAELEGRLI